MPFRTVRSLGPRPPRGSSNPRTPFKDATLGFEVVDVRQPLGAGRDQADDVVPSFSGTVTASVPHEDHAPEFWNGTDATVEPFTTTSAPRASDPLAKPISTVASPALVAFTVNCAAVPAVFGVLQNPVPEYPAWFESIVPSQTAGASSAS
ncbi:hypothetical protein GCM10029992_27430 [Glycomyces albus]